MLMKLPYSLSFLALILLFVFNSCYAQITVEDSLGKRTLSSVPIRVATLNWDVAEQVIELGVTPIAMPNIEGYKQWVVKPTASNSIQDIGTRVEPNLERLAELNPDVIIIASPQLDLLDRLEQIAPVLYYQTYSADHNNISSAIENYRRIAKVLGKVEFAEQRLDTMRKRLNDLKQQLSIAYGGSLPNVAVFRFSSLTSIYLYGDNSITQYALNQLGMNPALPQPSTQWGVTQKRLMDLNKLFDDSVALYILPFDQEEKLKSSVLWKAMPFVQNNRVNSVESVWSYGGAMSIIYNAEALTQSLLEIAPHKIKTSSDK